MHVTYRPTVKVRWGGNWFYVQLFWDARTVHDLGCYREELGGLCAAASRLSRYGFSLNDCIG